MPQGSDYHQRQASQERRDRCNLEKVCAELDELRMRVRELEELVDQMAKKLDIKITDWSFWK